MTTSGVLHLKKNGPQGVGLSSMVLDSQDFQSDLPDQHMHVYFEDAARGVTVGVWTTTSMQETFGPYPGDEFMCILEGQVAMVDENRAETVIKAGETFCVRNGAPFSWKQTGFLRKFFVTYNRPDSVVPKIPSAEKGLFILRPKDLRPQAQILESPFPFEFSGPQPVQRDTPVFTNDTDNMHVGMWESEPFESKMRPFPSSEFVHLLRGEIFIEERSGAHHIFGPGDVFFVPAGSECKWTSKSGARKFYCMLTDD